MEIAINFGINFISCMFAKTGIIKINYKKI